MDTIDANTGVDTTGQESSSEPVETTAVVNDDGFISTTEFRPVEKEEPVEKVTPKAGISDGAEHKTPEPESKTKPFHEHPDWQRMKNERDADRAARETLEREIMALRERAAHPNEVPNVIDMGDEALSEAILNSPSAIFSQLTKQIYSELTQAFEQKSAAEKESMLREMKIKSQIGTFEKFFTDNPEARTKWDSGEITAYMRENPGHNAISAYREMSMETTLKQAKEDAAKEAIAKYQKELKRKGQASSPTGSQPSKSPDEGVPPELEDSGKFGGRKAAAVRLLRSRLNN